MNITANWQATRRNFGKSSAAKPVLLPTSKVPLPHSDLVERMLAPNPKERLSLQGVMQHAWTNGETVGREEYRKEMNARVKKVMVRVRKEQELEMKQMFMREKGKRELEKPEHFPINIRREFEEKLFQLRKMLTIKDSSSSHSDASSLEEGEMEEAAKAKLETLPKGQKGELAKSAKVELRRSGAENKKEREDNFRNE